MKKNYCAARLTSGCTGWFLIKKGIHGASLPPPLDIVRSIRRRSRTRMIHSIYTIEETFPLRCFI
jgi:hypothetical protein